MIGEKTAPNCAGKVMAKIEVPTAGRPMKLKKRPSMLLLPDLCPDDSGFEKNVRGALEKKEIQVEGKYYHLASKKGSSREVMEDTFDIRVDDPVQAYFAVIDGHGGTAAANFVAENLGKNIVKALEYSTGKEEQVLEQAIRRAYSVTDKEFLSQGIESGACTSCVLLKKGELHVANVGDCRVVMSRKGRVKSLTKDHRLDREDERLRIEKSGGYVHCRHGVLRVQGALAVSRSIGDVHLKQWIISEPEVTRFSLTTDCQFLIIASDGLWDKVGEQEAVDVVLRGKSRLDACKELVALSCRRGNTDDVTVMVVDLENFVRKGI